MTPTDVSLSSFLLLMTSQDVQNSLVFYKLRETKQESLQSVQMLQGSMG